MYRQYHRNTIYTLSWGPNPENKQYVLYSCGEGELVYYDPEKPNQGNILYLQINDCNIIVL